jgi:putative transposase
VSPARRRDAVRFLVRKRRVSERRACTLIEQHRSTQRYEPQPAELELRLVARMNELAATHPRYGYRRVWALLRAEGFVVNRKRVERLWWLEGHRGAAEADDRERQEGAGDGRERLLEPAGDEAERGLVVRLHVEHHA